MPSSSPQLLPERTARGGARIAVHVTRRTFAYARPAAGTRLQRLTAPLLVLPVLAIVLALTAILIAVLLVVAGFFAAILAVAAVAVRRRLRVR